MRFSPVFTYSNQIVNRLTAITASREVILHAHLVPKWELSLRREQLVRAAHASTAIEGNPLTLEEVSQLAEGRDIMATRKAKAEVLNYLDVLRNITAYQKNGRITIQSILSLHRDISRGTLGDPSTEGSFRTVRVVVGNRVTKEIVYSAPPPAEVGSLMEGFVEWLNSDEARGLNPVIVAGIAHYELVRIHPFVDGNGRSARALATLILAMREFDIKRFFTLDDFYDSDRQAYYAVLRDVNKSYPDCTTWLNYFTEGVEISLHRVKERVLRLSGDEHRNITGGQVALSERQMKIIEFVHQTGSIKSANVVGMFHISRQAALKELTGMVDQDLLSREGMGRNTRYIVR
jgi:Fic family protein